MVCWPEFSSQGPRSLSTGPRSRISRPQQAVPAQMTRVGLWYVISSVSEQQSYRWKVTRRFERNIPLDYGDWHAHTGFRPYRKPIEAPASSVQGSTAPELTYAATAASRISTFVTSASAAGLTNSSVVLGSGTSFRRTATTMPASPTTTGEGTTLRLFAGGAEAPPARPLHTLQSNGLYAEG